MFHSVLRTCVHTCNSKPYLVLKNNHLVCAKVYYGNLMTLFSKGGKSLDCTLLDQAVLPENGCRIWAYLPSAEKSIWWSWQTVISFHPSSLLRMDGISSAIHLRRRILLSWCTCTAWLGSHGATYGSSLGTTLIGLVTTFRALYLESRLLKRKRASWYSTDMHGTITLCFMISHLAPFYSAL